MTHNRKRNNMNDLNEIEKPSIKSSDKKCHEISKELIWYDSPILQTLKSFQRKTTAYSSLCTNFCIGITFILFLPIILIIFILFLVLWILPGFGWFYERYAEARDRKKFYPPMEEMKPWGLNNKFIHVVHLRAPESRFPPIVHLSGMSISMYYLKPLLSKFVEFMGEPVEILSYDPPGYGASEPPNDWNMADLESEIKLLQEVIEKSNLRKPFILIGGSAGGLLAHLYHLTYPDNVAGMILLDPTPLAVFEPESPTITNIKRLSLLFKIMAYAASWGLFRPVTFLFDYFGVGDFSNFFRPSYPGYIATLMTQSMLHKLANQLRCFLTIPNYVAKLQTDASIHKNLAILAVGAPDKSKAQLCRDLNEEETIQWWCNSQRVFLCNSNNAGFIFREDQNHMQCVLDMELAANATKIISKQIYKDISH